MSPWFVHNACQHTCQHTRTNTDTHPAASRAVRLAGTSCCYGVLPPLHLTHSGLSPHSAIASERFVTPPTSTALILSRPRVLLFKYLIVLPLLFNPLPL
jgi:hypothetical protein